MAQLYIIQRYTGKNVELARLIRRAKRVRGRSRLRSGYIQRDVTAAGIFYITGLDEALHGLDMFPHLADVVRQQLRDYILTLQGATFQKSVVPPKRFTLAIQRRVHQFHPLCQLDEGLGGVVAQVGCCFLQFLSEVH